MARFSKRHSVNRSTHSSQEPVAVPEAVKILKGFQAAKFDETVEIAVRLGIDPRQGNQNIRGAFSLPHGIGKEVKVIAFVDGPAAEEAKAAGAIEVGGAELADKISGGWFDFDVAIAHPSMMRFVGKLGKVLGPQGKMPTPKSGTVTTEVPSTVADFVAGKIEFRNDAGGIVHAPVGRRSFDEEKLSENIEAFIGHLAKMKPNATKGVYMKKVHIKSTMSPSVPIEVGA
ncbi:MAG: 50S ribosomal protein L1 [Planctomycetota bacterium]|nr:50S ribosomal protein L1 [Planctomycetota bacterium]